MSSLPAFNATAYPSFLPARLFRVLVGPDGLYFIRMKALVHGSDAPGGPSGLGMVRVISTLIDDQAKQELATGMGAIEGRDPDKLLGEHKHNFYAPRADFLKGSIDPPSVLGGKGFRWKFAFKGRRPETFFINIDDQEGIRVALEHLPKLLGPALAINVHLNDKKD